MISGTLIINGKDALQTWGLAINAPSNWAGATEQRYTTAAIPRRQGAIITGPVAEQPRTMTFAGFLVGATMAATRTALDALQAEITGKSFTLSTADYTTRQLTCYCTGVQVTGAGSPVMANAQLPISLTIVAYDPYWYDIAQTSLGLNSTAPLGDAPVRPVITTTFTGARASETITLMNNAQTITYGSITVTPAGGFVNGDVLVIDMNAMTITKNGASILSSLSAGDFFTIDPALHAVYSTSTWPQVKSAAAQAGVANSLLKYYKAWR